MTTPNNNNIDPTFDSRNAAEDLYKMIDHKAIPILKSDVCFQHRQIVKKAIEAGLIRKKTDEEIQKEISKKPWLKINKLIRRNEELQDEQ